MNRLRIALIVLAAVLLTLPASAQTVDEIIAKNIESRGGMDAIKAVETVRVSGKMTMGGGAMEAPFALELKRPGKVRSEFTIQGMTAINAYDGETGWSVMPFMGKPDPEPMAEDQLKQVKDQADFIEGPLIGYEEKGHQVELLGKEEVEGTEAWKLKVTKANGDVVTMYLDTDYYLEFRAEASMEVQGNQMNVVQNIGDYKEVGDLVLAHSIEMIPEGMPQGQVITLDKIELNPEISDDRFTMPEPAPKAEEEEKKE
jgi:outer membrane lipoprotein-sorting protein